MKDTSTLVPHQVDICVAGGGPAGLIAAAAFGALGLDVLCVDPAAPVTQRDEDGADLRTTAFLQPSQAFLARIGLWDRFAEEGTPLGTMRIADSVAGDTEPRILRDFDSEEIGDAPFGWNLPNWLLRREVVAHLDEMPTVTCLTGVAVAGATPRLKEILVALDNGQQCTARLLVAADGRLSTIRERAGIRVTTMRYGQKALAFAVTHPLAHGNVSTEIHRSGGPFTLVPLPDYQGHHSSAVVWMERGPNAVRLAEMAEDDFNQAATERSAHVLGPLTLVSRRSVWPIISQVAHRFSAPRTALVAEAAHVVPPIGAQGLNMSLADIACLHALAEADDSALGSPQMLAQYERRRRPDVLSRVAGIDALNRISMLGAPPLTDLRMRGIDMLHRVRPVRRGLMRLGLGAG